MPNNLLTVSGITREALAVLERNLVFAQNINRTYEAPVDTCHAVAREVFDCLAAMQDGTLPMPSPKSRVSWLSDAITLKYPARADGRRPCTFWLVNQREVAPILMAMQVMRAARAVHVVEWVPPEPSSAKGEYAEVHDAETGLTVRVERGERQPEWAFELIVSAIIEGD